MQILAYCAQSFEEAAARVTGITPMTCPPYMASMFDPHWLEGYDLLYFDFHGLPGVAYWYEEERGTLPNRYIALSADQLRQANLKNTIVVALTCHLADTDSPMLDALLAAGATYVIGGDGRNWASTQKPTGAGLLAKRLIEQLKSGAGVLDALATAKRAIRGQMVRDAARLRFRQVYAGRDTLGFRAYYREDMA